MTDRIQMQISNKFLPNTHSREIIRSLCNNLRGFGAEIKVTKFSLSLISKVQQSITCFRDNEKL